MPEGAQLTGGVSPMLTALAIGYLGDQTEYIASRIFPTIPVAAPTGLYPIWLRGDFYRQGGKRLANKEAAPLVDFATGKGQYTTDHWGVGAAYTAKEVAEARQMGQTEQQLREDHTFNVTTKALIDREVTMAALLQTTANWTTTYAGVASAPNSTQFVKWDVTGSTPVDDVKRASKRIKALTGKKANKFVISDDVKDVLLKNAQILALWNPTFVGGSRPTVLNLAQLAEVLEVDTIEVADAQYNAAAEGQADNFQPIWSNTAWLGYVTDRPGVRSPSAGYTFAWNGDVTAGLPADAGSLTGAGPNTWGSVKNDQGLFIRTYQENRPQAKFIELERFDQPNIVAVDLAATFSAPIG